MMLFGLASRRGFPKRRALAAPAVGVLAALASDPAIAQEGTAGARTTARCSVEEQAHGPALVLRGRAWASANLSGRYRLHLMKTGPAGTSNIDQGGEITLEPGVEASVGQFEIRLERGGRYEAVLTLTLGARVIECRSSGPAVSDL